MNEINKTLYVRVDWPESQEIPEWLPKDFDECIPVADYAGYMVPLDIYKKYRR